MTRFFVALSLVLSSAGLASGQIFKRGGVRPPTPAVSLNNEELLAMKAPPNERYYILIFGSQGTPLRARYCHTWATSVKVTENPATKALTVEEQTISWMPATLVIKPLRFRVQQGVNLGFHFTIEEMYRNGEHISVWGPYETWHGLHYRFSVQKKFMDSGVIGYQAIDTIGEASRRGTGCDCIHAVSDMDPLYDRKQGYWLKRGNYGEQASANIVRQMMTRPILVKPEQTHDWLYAALDMEKYPIIRRTYSGPMVEFTPEALLEEMRRAGLASPK